MSVGNTLTEAHGDSNRNDEQYDARNEPDDSFRGCRPAKYRAKPDAQADRNQGRCAAE